MRSLLCCMMAIASVGCRVRSHGTPGATQHPSGTAAGDGGAGAIGEGGAAGDGGSSSADGAAAPGSDLGPAGCGAHGQPTVVAQHQSGIAALQLTGATAWWSLAVPSPPSGVDAILVWGMDLATGNVALRHGVSGGSEIPQVPLAAFQTKGNKLYLQGPGAVKIVDDDGTVTLSHYQNGMSGSDINPGGGSWIDDKAVYFIAPNWNGQYNPILYAPYAAGPNEQIGYAYFGSVQQPGPEHLGALLTDDKNLYLVSVEYDSLPPNDIKRGHTDVVRVGLDGGGPQQLLHTSETIGYAFMKQDAANVYVVQEYFDYATLIAVDKTGAGAKLVYQAPRYLDITELEIDDRFVAWVEGDSGLNQFTLKLQNRCSGAVDTLATTNGTSAPRHLALGAHHLFWIDGPQGDATVRYVPL